MPRKNKKSKQRSNNYYPPNVPFYPNYYNQNMYQQYLNFPPNIYNTCYYPGNMYTNYNARNDLGNHNNAYNNVNFNSRNYNYTPNYYNDGDKYSHFNNAGNYNNADNYSNDDNYDNSDYNNGNYCGEGGEAENATNVSDVENNSIARETEKDNNKVEAENSSAKSDAINERNKDEETVISVKGDSSCSESHVSEVAPSEPDDGDTSDKNTDRPNIRTIPRVDLIQKVSFYDTYITQKASSSDYTDTYWQRQVEDEDEDDDDESDEDEDEEIYSIFKNKNKRKETKSANKLEKRLNKMLDTPVEMSKGKSLLEKMGWKGGGLGRDGAGILEPIKPEATYAASTKGLGQFSAEVEEDEKFPDRIVINSLLHILEFVKNDLEIEMKFDGKLLNKERKRVHQTVEKLRMRKTKTFPSPCRAIVRDIFHHNHYVLVTESQGKRGKRQLSLYKEPKDHTFMITPYDFDDEDDKDKDILGKIIKYFEEYTKDEVCTEMRFLGPFNYEERCLIDMFYAVCREECNVEQSDKVKELFNSDAYDLELIPDNNGRLVIHKSLK